LAFAGGLLVFGLAGCVEWVSTREGPEAIPLATARRICDDYAEREIEGDRPLGMSWPSGRRSTDRSRYSYYFNRCMRAQGWELRRRDEASEQSDAPPDP
jgi:hypothetical protein